MTAERELGELVVCLRTDRGGEFNSKAFQEYCAENGIKRQLTAAYTPQQNGVAERKNISVMNMVRCMLFGMKVPLIFWPEAVQYAVHILNRSPTSILGDVTPAEKWSEHKPSLEHLRVFGCVAFALIPYERRVKLDEKSIKCVMFGVSKESKAYRLYNPLTKKIIISRDIRFDEKKSWSWDEDVEKNKFIENPTNDEEEVQENSHETTEGEESNDEQEEVATEPENAEQSAGVGASGSGAGRVLQRPAWMKDYECKGMGLYMEEDGEELVALFVGR